MTGHAVAPVRQRMANQLLCRPPALFRMPRINMLRTYTSATMAAAPASAAAAEKPLKTASPIVAFHLLACAALVFLIILVGGITRLTESGLSITEWNPGLKGMRLPHTEEEWTAEWDKYKESPEFKLLNFNMTLQDFKKIFLWEWSHRVLGRFIGVFFIVPAAYFCVRRGMTTPEIRRKLLYIGLGIGFQGLLGWIMVASGLKNPYDDESAMAEPRPEWTPRVSHFRLAAHLGAAFALYMGMVYTAVTILRDTGISRGLAPGAKPETYAKATSLLSTLNSPALRKYRRVALAMTGLVCVTVMYGAFVAGLDAGLVYSEFPKMGTGLLPPKEELMDVRYVVRKGGAQDEQEFESARLFLGNVTQNPVTVQAIHRYLGLTTLTSAFIFLFYSKKRKHMLPYLTPRFAAGAAHMSGLQALLGIFTLIYMVPLPLASMHQGGAVVLLTFMTCVLASIRRPGQAIQAFAKARGLLKPHAPTATHT
ncbi:Cytochrome c oxidase assembly protein cox15 [Malassezia vespertilionis]|uniref:Cytochrome c oxidase assembly protein cox15 n=1 Tax=Malassezia vespertilionis TaxID=2020962 RepID=UPI0024B1DBCD|nr:Cytochrome c oxidase assembly protein cox15 [Malassezia vespertilionis]WFD06807.1 Cytochrome c oxidase assembly protein cox15 [Malassezia vespertilionis]